MMGFTLLYLGFCCFLVPIPRNIQPKNEGDLSLNSLVGEKKNGFLFLSWIHWEEWRHGTASDLGSYCPLYVLFLHIHLNLPGKETDIWYDKCMVFFFFSWRSDCSFFPWKGQSVFQKFQPWVFEKLIRVACLSLFTVFKWVLAIFT